MKRYWGVNSGPGRPQFSGGGVWGRNSCWFVHKQIWQKQGRKKPHRSLPLLPPLPPFPLLDSRFSCFHPHQAPDSPPPAAPKLLSTLSSRSLPPIVAVRLGGCNAEPLSTVHWAIGHDACMNECKCFFLSQVFFEMFAIFFPLSFREFLLPFLFLGGYVSWREA